MQTDVAHLHTLYQNNSTFAESEEPLCSVLNSLGQEPSKKRKRQQQSSQQLSRKHSPEPTTLLFTPHMANIEPFESHGFYAGENNTQNTLNSLGDPAGMVVEERISDIHANMEAFS